MPRSLVVGNGNLLVTLDKRGLLQDFYFPYVGMEDHTTFGHYHRIGVYDEERHVFSWLTDDHWESASSYEEETLVGVTELSSEQWELSITFRHFVHPTENVLCREVTVTNGSDRERHLRFFFNFDFHLYGVKANDTAYYSPKRNCLVFYKYNRYFLANAQTRDGGIAQFTTGKAEYQGLEGTWRDAEDGNLSSHPVEQGSVDGTFAVHVTVPVSGHETFSTWICAARTYDEVQKSNRDVSVLGVAEYLDYARNYWKSWVNKQEFNFTGVPENLVALFKRSLLTIRTQVDNRGAIIAANDSDIMKFNKDSYSYMWPRDGALVAKALDDAGYSELTKRFFKFCAKAQSTYGYLLHKYNPDGSLGSSWHPWLYEGRYEVPIQEDETALPIIALENYYQRCHDIEFVQQIYDQFVLKAANFLCVHRDDETGLPLPSYDLWEEQKGVFTFTCSTVYQGLLAAARLSEEVGHPEHAKRFVQAAKGVKDAMLEHLYCEREKTFVKKLSRDGSGAWVKDYQADASIAGVFLFDVLPADDERVVSTMRRIKEKLWVPTNVGGLARYGNDQYQRAERYPENIPGNPWIITTLWYAQWLLRCSKRLDDRDWSEAEDLMQWVAKYSSEAGILAEQLHPFTGEPLSVAPLTWSHATFIDTVMLYRSRLDDFGICEDCKVGRYR